MKTPFALRGIFAAALLSSTALPALAQDQMDMLPINAGVAAAEEIAGVAVLPPVEASAQAEGEQPAAAADEVAARVYDETGDPITQAATRLLDETGILARQRAAAEAILIMDQQLKFNAKLEELLMAVGPDAEIEVAPGEFRSYGDTPAGLRAQIEMLRLKQELARMTSAEEFADIDLSIPAPATPEQPLTAEGLFDQIELSREDEAPVPTRSRSDGTGFQNGSFGAAAEQPAPRPEPAPAPAAANSDPAAAASIAALIEEAERRLAAQEARILRNVVQTADRVSTRNAARPAPAQPEQPAQPDVPAMELLEIWGGAGNLTAKVMTGGAYRELRVGDEIAGQTVSRITRDALVLTKDGLSTEIPF